MADPAIAWQERQKNVWFAIRAELFSLSPPADITVSSFRACLPVKPTRTVLWNAV